MYDYVCIFSLAETVHGSTNRAEPFEADTFCGFASLFSAHEGCGHNSHNSLRVFSCCIGFCCMLLISISNGQALLLYVIFLLVLHQLQQLLAISNVDLLLLCYQRHVQEDPWYVYIYIVWLFGYARFLDVFSAMRRFPNRGSTEKPLPGATLTHRGRNGFDRFLHGRCFILGYVSGIHPLLEISSVS